MDKQQVIQAEREGYSAFRESITDLTDEEMKRPAFGTWSVREVVAHLAGWHEQLGTGLERVARGERPTPEGVDWSDVNGWNARFAAEAEGQSPAELLSLLDERVERFMAALDAVPDDRFGDGKTVNRLAAGAGYGHFEEHAREIEEARKSRRLSGEGDE